MNYPQKRITFLVIPNKKNTYMMEIKIKHVQLQNVKVRTANKRRRKKKIRKSNKYIFSYKYLQILPVLKAFLRFVYFLF